MQWTGDAIPGVGRALIYYAPSAGFHPSTLNKPGIVVHTCNPNPQEVKTGKPELPSQLQLHSESKANLKVFSSS